MKYVTDPHARINYFETSDLTLASFLRCREFRLRRVEAQGDKALFVFGDSTALRNALVDYANNATVPVRTLRETMQRLKSVSRQILASAEQFNRQADKLHPRPRPASLHPRPTAAWMSA